MMKRRWILGGAALATVAVMGTVGAIAYAGVSGAKHHSSASHTSRVSHTSNTASSFCFYVDRSNGGDSHGDLSVVPKYGNKTCVKGNEGPKGATGATGATGQQGPKGVTGLQWTARSGRKAGHERARDPETRRSSRSRAGGHVDAPGAKAQAVGPNTVTLATRRALLRSSATAVWKREPRLGPNSTTSQTNSFLQWDRRAVRRALQI